MHVYMCTHMYKHIHSSIHTDAHTHKYTHVHTHTNTHTHTYTHTHIHTNTHTHTHIHTCTHARTHTHTHTHEHTHLRTHTNKQRHTQTSNHYLCDVDDWAGPVSPELWCPPISSCSPPSCPQALSLSPLPNKSGTAKESSKVCQQCLFWKVLLHKTDRQTDGQKGRQTDICNTAGWMAEHLQIHWLTLFLQIKQKSK